jgi:hypothetical protein
MEEINLENPIFAFYLNIDGMSHQTAKQSLLEFKKSVTYTNITSWIIPTKNETKVECVYPGNRYNTPELESLVKEINERVDLLSNSESFEDFKINIRDSRISKLFNETNK